MNSKTVLKSANKNTTHTITQLQDESNIEFHASQNIQSVFECEENPASNENNSYSKALRNEIHQLILQANQTGNESYLDCSLHNQNIPQPKQNNSTGKISCLLLQKTQKKSNTSNLRVQIQNTTKSSQIASIIGSTQAHSKKGRVENNRYGKSCNKFFLILDDNNNNEEEEDQGFEGNHDQQHHDESECDVPHTNVNLSSSFSNIDETQHQKFPQDEMDVQNSLIEIISLNQQQALQQLTQRFHQMNILNTDITMQSLIVPPEGMTSVKAQKVYESMKPKKLCNPFQKPQMTKINAKNSKFNQQTKNQQNPHLIVVDQRPPQSFGDQNVDILSTTMMLSPAAGGQFNNNIFMFQSVASSLQSKKY